MDYPTCPVCGDTGPHRLRETSERSETWSCGFCGWPFVIEIAEPASVGTSTT